MRPSTDFNAVMELLGEDLDFIPSPPGIALVDLERLTELEARYLRASPETKARSRSFTAAGARVQALLPGAMGSSCAVGAGEAIGCVGDRTGSSGFTRLDLSDDAEGEGTGLKLSELRLNCACRSASLAAVARSLRSASMLRSFSSAFSQAVFSRVKLIRCSTVEQPEHCHV
jgi:hypothetical protein